MRVLMTAAEMAPLAKTGGLGDVLGGLPSALAALGHEVTVVMPFYRSINAHRWGIPLQGDWTDAWIGGAHVFGGIHTWEKEPGVEVCLVAQDEFFGRDGIYGDSHGPFGDNDRRFAFLAQVTLEVARRMARQGRPPDIFHGHDWHAGLVPVYLAEGRAGFAIPSVFSIHNIQYQGRFGREILPVVGLSDHYYHPDRLELWGTVSFLKGGLAYSRMISTVSKGYAREILTYEFGEGLADFLWARRHDLVGIRNGIDVMTWNPATDPLIAARYRPGAMQGKDYCKFALQQEFDLPPRQDVPLLAMVTRLTEQKGLDLVLPLLPELLKQDVQVVVLGTGETRYEQALEQLAWTHPTRMGVRIAFNETLAHRVEAGADIFLMPSRFEPCGLNQMYSLRYATIPVVRAVGGLDDVVQDLDPDTGDGNGFKFLHYDVQGLRWAVDRALTLYRRNRPFWYRWREQVMQEDFSWERSAAEYVDLYQEAIARSRTI